MFNTFDGYWKKWIGLCPLTTGVNFINILFARFLYKSKFCNFSLITVRLCDFLVKGLSKKSTSKMLMKLATDVNTCKVRRAYNYKCYDKNSFYRKLYQTNNLYVFLFKPKDNFFHQWQVQVNFIMTIIAISNKICPNYFTT